MTRWKYLLNSAWSNFTENRLMSFVAVGSTSLALLILGGVLLFQQNTTRFIRDLKSKTSVVVFLSDGISPDRRQQLQSKLLSRPEILSVDYRTEEDALKQLKNWLDENSDLLEGLSNNPLPASFQLSLKPEAISNVEELANRVSDWNGVETVDYGQGFVTKLESFSQATEITIGIVGLILYLVAVFIIFNTIQLSVLSRKDEIDILKLVGATRKFIGFPFVVGGIIQGVIGSVFGLLFLYLLHMIVRSELATLTFIPIQLTFLSLWRVVLVLFMGFLLGVMGSVTAVRRSVRGI